jgi:His/Glu/Gln/Arg/opine family amino acid ABC transporter permease subunit
MVRPSGAARDWICIVTFDLGLLQQNLDVLIEGAVMTVRLTVVSGAISLVSGIALAGIRSNARPWLGIPLSTYVELMQNTPLLITLYLIYFGLPMVGIMIPTVTSVIVALVMQHSVFIAEIVRGGVLSVNATQVEAGKALGMSDWEIFRIVRFPQIIATIAPPLTGAFVIILHDTSLAAAISLVDLTMAAKVISQRTAASFEPFIAIAVGYSVISWSIGAIARRVERRMQVAR